MIEIKTTQTFSECNMFSDLNELWSSQRPDDQLAETFRQLAKKYIWSIDRLRIYAVHKKDVWNYQKKINLDRHSVSILNLAINIYRPNG